MEEYLDIRRPEPPIYRGYTVSLLRITYLPHKVLLFIC